MQRGRHQTGRLPASIVLLSQNTAKDATTCCPRFLERKTHEHIFNPFVLVLIFGDVKLQVINALPSHRALCSSHLSVQHSCQAEKISKRVDQPGGFGQRNAIATSTEKEHFGHFSNGIEMWAGHSLHPQWRRSGCPPAVQNDSSHLRHETFKAYSPGPAKTLQQWIVKANRVPFIKIWMGDSPTVAGSTHACPNIYQTKW